MSKKLMIPILISLCLCACDGDRVYETNLDFDNRYWALQDQPTLDFVIEDTTLKYNLYFNLRNELSYPRANLYFTYYLEDSTHSVLRSQLLSEQLFEAKTGKPFGSTVLGDIYDHQFPLLENYEFKHPGKYTMRYEQFMRMDTLPGVMAVGLRVEKAL